MKLSQNIRIAIIEKMVKHRLWGGKHTSIDNIPKGFPSNMIKDVKIEIKNLIKEGYIIHKPTSYGLEVSLNPRMKNEIEEIIKSSD